MNFENCRRSPWKVRRKRISILSLALGSSRRETMSPVEEARNKFPKLEELQEPHLVTQSRNSAVSSMVWPKNFCQLAPNYNRKSCSARDRTRQVWIKVRSWQALAEHRVLTRLELLRADNRLGMQESIAKVLFKSLRTKATVHIEEMLAQVLTASSTVPSVTRWASLASEAVKLHVWKVWQQSTPNLPRKP